MASHGKKNRNAGKDIDSGELQRGEHRAGRGPISEGQERNGPGEKARLRAPLV